MTPTDLTAIYRGYIDCLNRQDWARLAQFVSPDAVHNGRRLGVDGYRDMLVEDFDAIPDLRFVIDMVVADPPRLASRLLFDCRPRGRFLGLDVNGRRVAFSENVFYEFRNGKIAEVWSLVDRAAIEAQLKPV